MQRSWSILLTAVVAMAFAVAAGCNYAIPALWVAQGPPKAPAAYTLPTDLKTTVFVDDRLSVLSRTQLRAMVADDVLNELKAQGLVEDVISGRELIGLVRRSETPSRRITIEELGNAVGAELVVYVEMVSFSLMPDGASPQPEAEARVKVVDVRSKKRLFPEPFGGDTPGYTVKTQIDVSQPGIYRTSAGRRMVEDMLAKSLADQIAKVFYPHEPRTRAFGQGVSGLGN